jgi:hypothetical protein
MTDSTFTNFNTNILTFIGMRTKRNITLPPYCQVPDIYNETLCINIEPYENNFIQAVANYLDEGNGFETSVPYVDYAVTGASGIFEGYKIVRINFYNNGDPPGSNRNLGKVRIVTIF